ncbi:beta-1,6-N-acetylglucosaminyltransferase [Acinetobacter soli]|uniref:beta-1,6-N-acetylglucosaminyltransferase n=1 Tax=Acinetobacter soli TaxID=487316 RepID=UPI0028136208|nr:beta-1,6-N-acetylglucosaminyltransferase [Acinetobacter soli]MDQ9833120.1 beta-1,6-N-acetylglucosaminyltransferase [Acinetobacter soli]
MSKKIAILVLAHKSIDYVEILARDNKNIFFFIHMDKKTSFTKVKIDNLIYLDEKSRVDVKWGGFSQVRATLNLLNFAINYSSELEFFHLISGEDVFLSSNKMLEDKLSWAESEIFLDIENSRAHRYRARFNAIHAETKIQRRVLGKFLTILLKIFDRLIPTRQEFWFGSNWFSIRRSDLEILLNAIQDSDIRFFRKKLNPDEHFFQYIVSKNNLKKNLSFNGNNRYIIFNKKYNNGNNPVYLNCAELMLLSNTNFFFARKVNLSVQLEFYDQVNKNA